MFGPSITVDSIKVSDQRVLGPLQDVPVTPSGQTIFWPTDLAGRAYSNDFSTSDIPTQALFLHEVTHIWQSQHDVNVSGLGIVLQFKDRMLGESAYSLAGATAGTAWSDLNIEQQGEVVANIWLMQHNRIPTNGNLSLENLQNIFGSSPFHNERPIEPAQSDSGPKCFVAGTKILLADGSSKPIEQIQIGDFVLAFAGNSALSPRRVIRLFENITTDLLELAPLSDRESEAIAAGFDLLTVTPGHAFLTADGSFIEIGEIVLQSRLQNRAPEIVLASGAKIGVDAKLIRWTEKTAGKYEPSQAVDYQSHGNTALAPRIQQGWKTYNFEVEELNTYVAGGVRVHNQSAPTLAVDENQFEEEFGHPFNGSASDADLLAGAIESGSIRPVADYVDATGNDRYDAPFFTESGEKVVISMDSTTWFASMVKNGEIERIIQNKGDGSRKDTFFDSDNTHPYDKLDIDEGPNGRITGVQVTLDPAVAAVASVAQVLGSAIGRALAPNNQLAQLAAGTLAGTVASAIGQKFGQVLSASLSQNASQISLDGIFNNFGLNLASAAAGSVASLITAELGTALGLHGYGAQLFDAGVGGLASQVATQLVQKGGLSALNAIDWAEALGGAAASLGGAVGSILGNQIVHAETQTGAIAGQLLGAVGSVIGASFVIGQSLSLLLDFVIPGIGSLIGTVIGTLLGDAFGPGTPHPASTHIVDWTSYLYTDRFYAAVEGGQSDTSKAMADAAAAVVNSYLEAVNGAALDHGKQVMIGYRTDGDPSHPYFSGWLPGVTPFATASEAVFATAVDVLHNTEVIGGNLLLKRAHANSVYSDTSVLGGDLQVAQDYENYLNNREAINALMATNPESAFTAGWIATFARVNDLGLNHLNRNDFNGGLVGWLDSVKKAGFNTTDVTFSQTGNTSSISVKAANGAYVPGTLAAFADQLTQASDAAGTTVKFTITNGLVPLGFQGPSSSALVSGKWQVSSGSGNNIWFAPNDAPSEYHDNNPGQSHDILIGGASADYIYAGNGWNFVDGGAANDRLETGSGNDILHGGRGDDYLTGGGGNDSYTFNRGDGSDDVVDHYSYAVLDSTGGLPPPGGSGGSTHQVHDNGGTDTLAFGAGVGIADVSLISSGLDVIVAVKDPAHPGAAFAQLTDRIALRNWGDALDRIETISFADGTVLSIADSAAFAALRVPFGAILSRNTVAENAANGTVVGTMTGIDLDPDPQLRYTLLDNAGGRFAIDAVSGVVTVANGIMLDYETATSHDISVRVTDSGGAYFNKAFTIKVTDVNEVFTGNGGDNTFAYPGGHYAFNGGNGGFDVLDLSHFTSAVLVNLNATGTQVWTTDAATLQQGNWRPLVDLSGGVENAVGAGGDTTFYGNSHDNVYTAGPGNDFMAGGGGHDSFVFRPGFGRDTINDFGSDDIIRFDPGQFAGFAAIAAHTADDGHGNTVISLDASHSVTLNHVLKASLVAGEFGMPLFPAISFALAGFAPGAGGWISNDIYPRHVADVNGDGMADIVGFGNAGVLVSLATGGGSFGSSQLKLAGFGTGAGGWISNEIFPRHVADVNGDGMADIVGFGNAGVLVSLATGGGNFAAAQLKLAAFNLGNGWVSNDQFPRELADVNGDGMADIVGFGNGGVYVALATGGGSFAAAQIKLAAFNPGNGWVSNDQFPRELADVNGDGMADVVGFGNGGVYVALATGGGNFAPFNVTLAAFNAANGWTSNHQFPRQLADVNDDGMADIVGFGNGGVHVALATGGGNFAMPEVRLAAFNQANGWTGNDQFPRTLGDVNGDGAADIIGFGQNGVLESLSNGFHLI
jgi:hypothetical protein